MTGPPSARSAASPLLSVSSYREALERFDWTDLWALFSGTRDKLNITDECLDRHRESGVALRLRRADGAYQVATFEEIASAASRFAHFLVERGVKPGERVAVMLEPSLEFYAALFGTMKCGSVAVPLFTLFGPEGLKLRLEDCGAKILIVDAERAHLASFFPDLQVIVLSSGVLKELARYPGTYASATRANDLAILQYTSGTSRQLPDAIRHTHRAIVTVVLAALFGLGLKPGDRYFCPSSPAWGHGLWHGTIAPWALGIAAGAYAGRFSAVELVAALRHFEIDNLAAAGTIYRMAIRDGLVVQVPRLAKASYTGEALDPDTLAGLAAQLGAPVCGMYGTTEVGVIIANYPGFRDYEVRHGALGKPIPGWEVVVLDDDGRPAEPGSVGEISVKRRGEWFRCKDLAQVDTDGYFWYLGRADDVIISAGWTISPLEVESVLAQHQQVLDVAVIGVPDPVRGQQVKAFVVGEREDAGFAEELQVFVRTRLSQHEYPRIIEFVPDLPRTPNGKVNRRALRALGGEE
jgi:acetyl-CoA synthetase